MNTAELRHWAVVFIATAPAALVGFISIHDISPLDVILPYLSLATSSVAALVLVLDVIIGTAMKE